MDDPSPWPRMTVLLVNLAAAILIIASVRAAAELVVPFLLALFVAAIVTPSIDHLSQRGVPRWIAVGLVILTVSVSFLLLLGLLGASLNDFLRRLPMLQVRLQAERDQLLDWIEDQGLPTTVEGAESTWLDTHYVVRMLSGLLAGLSGIFSDGLMILITLIFILLESAGFPAKLRAIVGPDSPSMSRAIQIIADLRRYMVIKTWISVATGVPVWLGLWLLEVDYALLWGMLAFLLNYVPNIGSLIAAIPPVMLAFLQNGLLTAVGVVILYLAVNFVIGYLVEPPAMGHTLGLSTLVVWGSLIVWGWILGPVGMFLSVPLTMTFKIILEGAEETRWLAILLGPPIQAKAHVGDASSPKAGDGST